MSCVAVNYTPIKTRKINPYRQLIIVLDFYLNEQMLYNINTSCFQFLKKSILPLDIANFQIHSLAQEII